MEQCEYEFEPTDERCAKMVDHEGAHATQALLDNLKHWMGYIPPGAPGNIGPCPTCGDIGHWYHPVADLLGERHGT